MTAPAGRYLSLGAGVQSSVVLLLAVRIGCPYHTDAEWLRLKEHDPAGWADAVDFDAAIRRGSARANAAGNPLRGEFYLHRQRVPLPQARLRRQATEGPEAPGCGPWTCPHQDPDAEPAA